MYTDYLTNTSKTQPLLPSGLKRSPTDHSASHCLVRISFGTSPSVKKLSVRLLVVFSDLPIIERLDISEIILIGAQNCKSTLNFTWRYFLALYIYILLVAVTILLVQMDFDSFDVF